MNRLIRSFSIRREQEDFDSIVENVTSGVEFSGTNLWILVFAIFIASLGLNVNSTAVVIGAMLISPLMGPIIGLGFGMAINDLSLLKKAASNYLFAVGTGLATSTIFFALSPLTEVTSELLARTSPNIYDVLIALFGGFAGILALSSKKRGNVIPGAAIATALMPPLCTAGYGLANLNFAYLGGAFYLFLINTVFIALATLVTARFLGLPRKHLEDAKEDLVASRLVWAVVVITLLPSIYFGYDIVQQNRFRQRADRFIELEAVFPNDYLLKKEIDGKAKRISLTYGGEFIPESKIAELREKMLNHGLENASLEIKQGFSILKEAEATGSDESRQLTAALNARERELAELRAKVGQTDAEKALGRQIYVELKAQYPTISGSAVERVVATTDDQQEPIWMAVITTTSPINAADKKRIEEFLRARVNTPTLTVFFETAKLPVPNSE